MAAPMAFRNFSRISNFLHQSGKARRLTDAAKFSHSRKITILPLTAKIDMVPGLNSAVSPHYITFQTHSTGSTFKQNCWKCEKEIDPKENQYFCACGLIQPPVGDRNYFEVLEVDDTFDLDTKFLTQQFRRMQTQLHPDKFAQKSQIEKDYSAEQSSNMNKAYQTLLKPLNRGLYMLEMRGQSIEESDIQAEPDFLMEIMETNEELVEATSLTEIRTIKETNTANLQTFILQTSSAFKNNETELAKQLLAKLKYYANIDEKIKEYEMLHVEDM